MGTRIRDPELLFRGWGAAARRVEKRWAISIGGPAVPDDVGSWYPREDLGEGEWLWVWKWSSIYEADFAQLGEWVFSGLAPHPEKDGGWSFEGSGIELYWLAATGSRLAVLEEDARGVLHVLEDDGSIELFAIKPASESGGSSSEIERSKQAAVPWRIRVGDESTLPEGGSMRLFEGLGLLPAFLLVSEVARDPQLDRLKGIRRVGMVLLSCLEATEFECEVSGRAVVRASLPRSSAIPADIETRELTGHVGGLRWTVRGPRKREFERKIAERVNRVLGSLARSSSSGSRAGSRAGSRSGSQAGGPIPKSEPEARD